MEVFHFSCVEGLDWFRRGRRLASPPVFCTNRLVPVIVNRSSTTTCRSTPLPLDRAPGGVISTYAALSGMSLRFGLRFQPLAVQRLARTGGGRTSRAEAAAFADVQQQAAPLPASSPGRQIASTVGFVLVNVWLVYHLAGIILAPWSVPPSSRLVQNAWRGVKPYVQLLFLNHGYHYFAPEPGNSTLVAYVLELPNGKRETGRIPNRGIRPRLLYHRHFMLTEFLAASENYPPAVRTELLRAMARELCHEHGGAPRHLVTGDASPADDGADPCRRHARR